MKLLLVDDDPGLRALLRTTFEVFDIDVDEAEDGLTAARAVRESKPDVVVLDVRMPGMSGLELCRRLKSDLETAAIAVVLLTGSDGGTQEAATECGADAFVRKPFSPLSLLAVVEQLAGTRYGVPFRSSRSDDPQEQLLLYARDLRHLVEIEKGQRALVQSAYRETVAALASALESKDTGTRQHSQRVQRYALELARAVDPALLEDPSTEYGFLLHDVGKIGIPDRILQKPGPLTIEEYEVIKQHPMLGARMLASVKELASALPVVRHHHERFDGRGYPDGLHGDTIPLIARVVCVADAFDAMLRERPYGHALSREAALQEVETNSGTQFDPEVVSAFLEALGESGGRRANSTG